MLHYIFQTIAFQLFFLLVYDFILKKETFFNWNRFYLITTALLSVILPFIKIESFIGIMPDEYIIKLPEVIIGQSNLVNIDPVYINANVVESTPIFTWQNLFYLGASVALILFAVKLARVIILIRTNPKTKFGKLNLVHLLKSTSAFSFFNYIFLGEKLKEEQREAILKHEMIHVEQNHTLDLLFFEVFRLLFWFNPLVYMYQNRIAALHEFIADAHAVKHQCKSEYYQSLLAQVFNTKRISFINPFYKQSLIKKRIVMLQKTKSKQIHLLKYTLLIPVVLGMLVYTSGYSQDETKVNSISDDALIKELMSEYDSIKNSGANKEVVFKAFHRKMNKEKCTKEEFYRMRILLNIELKDNPYVAQSSRDLFNKTYEEYLVWKNTDEAEKMLRERTNPDFFVFKGQQRTNLNKRPHLQDKNIKGNVPFAVIEQPPVFPGCESLTTNEERKACMSQKISEFVAKKFNTNLGEDLGLMGRQRINVIFKIDSLGYISTDEIRAKAPHKVLEEEVIRVIGNMPKMTPGKQKGENVNVLYSLPIIFDVPEKKKPAEKN